MDHEASLLDIICTIAAAVLALPLAYITVAVWAAALGVL